ncbi:MAG: cytidine deaminase [Alphaproteobacteria bacterium]|nr:cytidine deaminase [Alphaproteobacteria bacterium]MBQ7285488.1 cytidine deaminase [Alphaproteobacteria bacterium]
MNNQQKLLSMAQTAASNAYCPYSHFAVGAAIESEDGKFYAGCNVENVSYPVGTCAETGAISAMIAGGSKRISAILIYADSKTLISPCGACRQRIAEFSNKNTPIYLADKNGIISETTAGELLPAGFKEF